MQMMASTQRKQQAQLEAQLSSNFAALEINAEAQYFSFLTCPTQASEGCLRSQVLNS